MELDQDQERDRDEERYNQALLHGDPAPMRCNCESVVCQTHEPARCEEVAYVRAIYIGGICLECAVVYPRSYLVALTGDAYPEQEFPIRSGNRRRRTRI
jgi:hypothetical protein